MNNLTIANIVKANKVLRRIKENPLVDRFPNLRELDQFQLQFQLQLDQFQLELDQFQ